MYTDVSNDLITLLNSDGRTFVADIRENGSSVVASNTLIKKISYSGGSNGERYITLGSTVSAFVELTLYKPDFTMLGKEYSIHIGAEINGSPEYLCLGYFTAQKPVSDGEEVKVTLYDRMRKFETPYFSELTYPNSASAVVGEICSKCGVLYEDIVASISIPTKPVGYTCREMIAYIAQLLGGFAVINRSGKLVFKWYTPSGYTIPQGRYWNPFNRSESNYVFHRMSVIVGKEQDSSGQTIDKTYSVGSGTKGIVFANPFYTQALLEDVYNRITSLTFRPSSVEAPGDPRLEPGDIITVVGTDGVNYTVPIMTLSFNYDGGLSMKIEAVGEEEQKDDFSVKGPTTQAMERMSAELILVNKLLANKIDVEELDANVINSHVINAKFATVDLANVTNGSITHAMLGDAIIDSANIKEGVIGTAHIADASIVDSKVVGISASKLTAGTIDAGEIDVVHLNAANITVGKINGVQIATGTLTRDNMGSTLINDIDSKVSEIVDYYVTSTSDTDPPGAEADWDVEFPVKQPGEYIWKKTKTVYGSGTPVFGMPVCLSGADGADGEDAVLLKIDSSRGNVFKNNAVSTLMTVTIYYGSDTISTSAALSEVFGAGAYLEWEWQRFGETEWHVISSADTRLADNGFRFTISPDDVDVKVNFRCKLNV